jgi:hypothetical protein
MIIVLYYKENSPIGFAPKVDLALKNQKLHLFMSVKYLKGLQKVVLLPY